MLMFAPSELVVDGDHIGAERVRPSGAEVGRRAVRAVRPRCASRPGALGGRQDMLEVSLSGVVQDADPVEVQTFGPRALDVEQRLDLVLDVMGSLLPCGRRT